MAGTKKDAQEFVDRWKGEQREAGNDQIFWIQLLQDVMGMDDALMRVKCKDRVITEKSSHSGEYDLFIPSASTIIEQKASGVDLSKPELRQGRMVTPAQQGRDYANGMPLSQRPRYIVACNFHEFWVYDMERDPLCSEPVFKLALADLPRNLGALDFLRGTGATAPDVLQQAVSKKAGTIMGRLHDLVAARYEDPDTPEAHHALSVLMTRIMFLMFAEDVRLSGPDGEIPPNAFRDYLQHFQAVDLRRGLKDLFVWLDTPDAERDPWAPDYLKVFPYMNGGLFRERIDFPPLDEDFRTTLIVEGCQEFDWSGVSPTVFGSIFEGALSHDHRRANGQHFTSPRDIHRVIDPLFLSALRAEYGRALEMAPAQKTRALRALHERIGEISVLDPAAGSGNFLTESYLSLRRLENMVMLELAITRNFGQASISFEGMEGDGSRDDEVLVNLRNFHGIEIEDFACCVARTALWIAEKQADTETTKVTRRVYQGLPLTDYEGIIMANALAIDWNDVVPADEVTHVCGNPPFIGQYTKTNAQTADARRVWGVDYDGYLDYATCWYRKAADYLGARDKAFAFVSTNSICQGQPVPAFFGPLWRDGWQISFAHRTFVWNSQADDEAHVHVVILGFEHSPRRRLLFTYERGRGEGAVSTPLNINGYLLDAPNVLVRKRMHPLGDIAEMVRGSQPTDNGFLQITTTDEYKQVMSDPIAAQYVRPCIGATELINAKERWCLWLEDATPLEIARSPFLKKRVTACHEWRIAQGEAAIARGKDPENSDAYKLRDIPHLFRPNSNRPQGAYLCVPRHFSGGRKYFTTAWCSNGEIATDACFMAEDPDGLQFAVISSGIFMAWQKAVGGELKSDCRFSNTVVWNNFPLPQMTPDQRQAVIDAGKRIIEARESYAGASLATLYDPSNEFLFPALFDAHKALDRVLGEAYGVDFEGDEEKIVAHLFRLYAEATKEL